MNNIEGNTLDMLARIYAQNTCLDAKLDVLLRAAGFGEEALAKLNGVRAFAFEEASKAILRRLGEDGGGDDEDSQQWFAPRW
jgi:hypothetical protein